MTDIALHDLRASILHGQVSTTSVPNVPSCWKAVIAWSIGTPAQIAESVIHVMAPFASAASAVATEVGNGVMVASGIGALMHNTAIGGQISVQPFDGGSAPQTFSVSGFTGVAMGSAGSVLGSNTARVFTKRTGLAGRSFRGRLYLAAQLQASLDPGGVQWTTGSTTTAQNAINASWAKWIGGPNITAVLVYSHRLNLATPVTSWVARQWIGTQRRRTTLHSP